MEVRPMIPSDLTVAADLSTQLGYPASVADLHLRLDGIAERSTDAVFVAVIEGTVVGWIHAASRVALESEPWLEIAGLVVDGERRGHGIGRVLLDAAERWGRERGNRVARVRSRLAREAAHRFYEREGYRRLKTQHVFDKPL